MQCSALPVHGAQGTFLDVYGSREDRMLMLLHGIEPRTLSARCIPETAKVNRDCKIAPARALISFFVAHAQGSND